MNFFTPTRPDGRSYRDVALDVLKDRQPGMIVTYEEAGSALGLDPARDRIKIQQAVRQANALLLKHHKRGVGNLCGVGYRILPAREHMLAATGHQSKADRSLGRAVAFFRNTNLAEMSPIERKLHQGQQLLAEGLLASHQHLDMRVKRIEDLLRGSKTVDSE